MEKEKVIPLVKDTYLAVIQNSLGSRLFQNFYAQVNGTKEDIMRSGDLSCAFFVSSILTLFGLIKRPHGTVEGTIKDMEEAGWQKTTEPRPGDVLVWEAITEDNETHKHIGFFIGDEKAISNSSKERVPTLHHWTFGTSGDQPTRDIIAMYSNDKLSH